MTDHALLSTTAPTAASTVEPPGAASRSGAAPGGVRERPILFSAPMVRALLAGTKTQTRRLTKLGLPSVEAVHAKAGIGFSVFTDHHSPGRFRIGGPVWAVRELMGVGPGRWACPYGVPGDRLWVRETFALDVSLDEVRPVDVDPAARVEYLADGARRNSRLATFETGKTRVSIHMPRWASRITLEVTEVRVQRLNSISEEDARAEGIDEFDADAHAASVCSLAKAMGTTHEDPRAWYAALWESINGPGSWAANEWVWCVSFSPVRP